MASPPLKHCKKRKMQKCKQDILSEFKYTYSDFFFIRILDKPNMTFFMLESTEHEISLGHKNKNTNS